MCGRYMVLAGALIDGDQEYLLVLRAWFLFLYVCATLQRAEVGTYSSSCSKGR